MNRTPGGRVIKLQFRAQPERFIGLTAPSTTIGRDRSNDLVVEDPSVSDFHAEIVNDAEGLAVIDLVSATGTFVNDRRVRDRQPLGPWDCLRLGNVSLEINDPSAPRPGDWALRVQSDLLADQFFALQPEMVLGRGAECDLTIDDAMLSRRHAELTIDPGGGCLHLRDLGSANGTFANGQRVRDATLRPGDELGLGTRRFIVVGPSAGDEADIENEDLTMVSESWGEPAPTEELHGRTELLANAYPAAYLVEETSVLGGRGPLSVPGPTCRLGRTPDNDIVVPDGSVSRAHAVLVADGGRWRIEDCQSSNGVLINGDRTDAAILRDGDLITLGRAAFRFRCDRH